MILIRINISKILKFNYNPEHKISGVINGVEWKFLAKKQIGNDLYGYGFKLICATKDGLLWTTIKTLITGDQDIRELVETIITQWNLQKNNNDHYIN